MSKVEYFFLLGLFHTLGILSTQHAIIDLIIGSEEWVFINIVLIVWCLIILLGIKMAYQELKEDE
jgi:hypothetical protein